jgi:hypothetical protein
MMAMKVRKDIAASYYDDVFIETVAQRHYRQVTEAEQPFLLAAVGTQAQVTAEPVPAYLEYQAQDFLG